ncbi:DeoR family transcriptional regulator [Candidatus Dojkabacteria bacterium]|uniref:DeoR family transcriptional regulator n=1 Tax=Candidatus Dojkabacteria bacterium TaxID=2099670 RepID=A0A955L5B5_9BACT|nr:DeoR family transcriptional regulator [Candidatus Dojkabacteria bacterium]
MNLIKNTLKGIFFVFGIMLGVRIFKNRKSDDMLYQEADIEPEIEKSTIVMKSQSLSSDLNNRQKRIIELIKEYGQVEMKLLRREFPDVTSRTLRRDLTKLSDENLIYKEGSTKAATYYLN